MRVSALPAVTTIQNTDVMIANATSVTSKITVANLKLVFQPYSASLDSYATVVPTLLGLNFIAAAAPSSTSYPNVSASGVISYLTPTQVVANLIAAGGVDLTTSQAMINKRVNGMTLSVATAPGTQAGSATTDVPSPSDTFPFKIVKVGYTGGLFNIRLTGSTDVIMPRSGLLATVANIFPDTSDDTKVSSGTVDLDSTDGSYVDVTGTTTITGFTLAQGSEKIVRFTGALLLTNSATLVLPGGANITTAANDYAVVRGYSGGIVKVLNYQSGTNQGSDIIYGSAQYLSSLGLLSGGTPYQLVVSSAGGLTANRTFTINTTGGNRVLTLASDFTTVGAFLTTLTSTAVTTATLPPGTHTLAAEVGNFSTADQVINTTTRAYIAGSAIAVPDSKLKIGTKLTWKFNMTKTAAGVAESTIDICVGTTGTFTDTARVAFVKPAGTAAADEAWVVVEAIVRGPLSASGIMVGQMTVMHNGNTVGHMTIPLACVKAISGAFDVTVSSLYVGLCLTAGASDAITIQRVSAQADNI